MGVICDIWYIIYIHYLLHRKYGPKLIGLIKQMGLFSRGFLTNVNSTTEVSEVTDQMRMAILSVTPEYPLLWAFLMQNFNLGIVKKIRYFRIRYFRKPLCNTFFIPHK